MRWLEDIVSFLGGEQKCILWATLCCLGILLSSLLGKILYWSIKGIGGVKRRILKKKARTLEEKRRLQFTLPRRGNGYLRERLNTALSGEHFKGSEGAEARLEYAEKMLAKTREANLSSVERLDVEEMAKVLSFYEGRKEWSGEEREEINEILGALLKLSAKYEIAV